MTLNTKLSIYYFNDNKAFTFSVQNLLHLKCMRFFKVKDTGQFSDSRINCSSQRKLCS